MKDGLFILSYGIETKSFLKIKNNKIFRAKVGLWYAKDSEGKVFNIKEGEIPKCAVLSLSDFGEDTYDTSQTDSKESFLLVSDSVYGVRVTLNIKYFVDIDLESGDLLAVPYNKEDCGKLYRPPVDFDKKNHLIVAKVISTDKKLNTITYVTIDYRYV
jgi:hypothetical protein